MALGWRKSYFRYKDYFLNVFKIYKTRNDLKVFLEILLSLGAIIIFTLFALKPTILTISQLVEDNKVKAQTIKEMDKKIANLNQAETNYNSIVSKLDLINSAIPQGPSPETIARQIEGLSNLYSVKLLGLSTGDAVLVGAEKTKKTPKELVALPQGANGIDFAISASGDYISLLNFLKGLETLRRPLNIDSLSLNASIKNDQKVVVLLVSGRFPYIPNAVK